MFRVQRWHCRDGGTGHQRSPGGGSLRDVPPEGLFQGAVFGLGRLDAFACSLSLTPGLVAGLRLAPGFLPPAPGTVGAVGAAPADAASER